MSAVKPFLVAFVLALALVPLCRRLAVRIGRVAQPRAVRALEMGLGDGWTPEVADAWGTAYGTLSGYMISEAYGRNQVPNKDIP